MATIKVKEKLRASQLPKIVGGNKMVFFSNTGGVSKGVKEGADMFVSTGMKVRVPEGFVALVSMSPEIAKPATGLVLADGMIMLDSSVYEELKIHIFNTSSTTRIVIDRSPLCELILVKPTQLDLEVEGE